MSHTNNTANYNLPQFIPTDKPAWLTDVNASYAAIDVGMHTAQTAADSAQGDATQALTDASNAATAAAAADAKGSGAIASIETNFDPTTIYSVGSKVMYNSLLYRCIVAVVTPGPWTGSDNWERITVDSLIATTDSKIGSLPSLSTTDKTSIVNAVNEVNGKFTPSAYSTTGLSYTNCTYVAGGYRKIGSLVIVNMRITVTAPIANGDDFISGFPKPIDEDSNMVLVSNNTNNGFTLKKDGALSNGSTNLSTGNAVLFSTAYLTRDI